MSIHDRYERLICACHTCRTACETMPGSLHPDDFERMAKHLGFDLESDEFIEWILANFVASDGVVGIRNGRLVRVGSIVPAQQENGHCVFLREGKCSIHAASPFSCSHFDCKEPVDAAQAKASEAANEMANHAGYFVLWNFLHATGRRVTSSITERRQAWIKARNSKPDATG